MCLPSRAKYTFMLHSSCTTNLSSCSLQDSASAADDTQSSDRAACKHAEATESNTRRGKSRKQKEKVGPWSQFEKHIPCWCPHPGPGVQFSSVQFVQDGIIPNLCCCLCFSRLCLTLCAAERPDTARRFTGGKTNCKEPPFTPPSLHTTIKPISCTRCIAAKMARSCR